MRTLFRCKSELPAQLFPRFELVRGTEHDDGVVPGLDVDSADRGVLRDDSRDEPRWRALLAEAAN